MTDRRQMIVDGYALPTDFEDAAIREIRQRSGFSAGEIKSFLLGLGVPDKPVQSGRLFGPAHRVVDRLLQRERRAGRIEYRQGLWHRAGNTERAS